MGIAQKRKIVLAFIACLLLGSVFQYIAVTLDPSCKKYAETTLADRAVINNVWNDDATHGVQCIFSDAAKRYPFRAMWAWAWPGRDATVPKSSAAIVYGFSPWRKKTTTGKLPVRISALKAMKAGYDISSGGDGVYATVLKLYLTKSARPSPKDINAEIMIWLDSRQAKPWAEHKGDIVAGGRKYAMWAGRVESWKFITLKPAETGASGVIDIQALLAALVKRRDIEAGLYLSAVQLGDEITSGRGYTAIRDFSVDMRL